MIDRTIGAVFLGVGLAAVGAPLTDGIGEHALFVFGATTCFYAGLYLAE